MRNVFCPLGYEDGSMHGNWCMWFSMSEIRGVLPRRPSRVTGQTRVRSRCMNPGAPRGMSAAKRRRRARRASASPALWSETGNNRFPVLVRRGRLLAHVQAAVQREVCSRCESCFVAGEPRDN
jgi:hypothetical protein